MSKLALALGLFAILLPLLPACDVEDPAPPTVVEKSAEEAAVVTTEVACEYVDRCGLLEVTCSACDSEGGDDSQCGGCFVELRAVTTDECEAELTPELEVGFGCETLTPAEEAIVDECLAGLPAAQCTTVEEMEAWVNGGDGEAPTHVPAACELVEEIRYRCFDYGSTDANPGEPIPG